MNIYVPDYYKDFKCIAEKCKHNCCIGWEIDIDEETYGFYKNVNGKFGQKLGAFIDDKGEDIHFILSQEERCPFLNKDNLCDIILNLGEENLCEICSLHPRFKNFFESRTEIGLGLCCEEAARIILTNKNPTKLVKIETEKNEELVPFEEQEFFDFRSDIFFIANNREKTFFERIKTIVEKYEVDIPDKKPSEWADVFLLLERLEPEWGKLLLKLKCSSFSMSDIFKNKKMCAVYEQLFVYFVYRHLADGLYDGRMKERLSFCILSVYIICMLWYYKDKENSLDTVIDISRQYSSEIEYSDKNVDYLLSYLKQS